MVRNKNTRTNAARATGPGRTLANLRALPPPSTPGEQRVAIWVEQELSPYTTAATTGIVANNNPFTASDITNFATRFGATFDTYRITEAYITFRPCNVMNGQLVLWLEELSTTTPTLTAARTSSARKYLNLNSSDGQTVTFHWRATELPDLDWDDTTALSAASFEINAYTSLAEYGATPSTLCCLVNVKARLELKGLL